jgi:cytochrome oxidase assembly protein ShyY1
MLVARLGVFSQSSIPQISSRAFRASAVASSETAGSPSSATAASQSGPGNAGGSGSSVGRKAGILFFSLLVGATFGLGAWQSMRYFWKKDVIEQREKALEEEPLDITATPLDEIPSPSREQLRLVKLKGKLDWARAAKISPRPPPKGLPDNYIPKAGNNGGLVVVPLIRGDGTEVLVIRGWYPLDELPAPMRTKAYQTAPLEDVKIFGTLRASEEVSCWSAPSS